MSTAGHGELAETRHALATLRQLEREFVELDQRRQIGALERVGEAVRRIGAGAPTSIMDGAAAELGRASELDRVLVSHVRDGELHAHALWERDADDDAAQTLARLRAASIPLRYPLVEADVATRPRAVLVDVAGDGPRPAPAITERFGWSECVVAAIVVQRTTIGLLHAGTGASGRMLREADRELVELYVDGLAGAFERAVLRDTLQRHRDELDAAVRWMSAHVGDRRDVPLMASAAAAATGELTARELQVLELLATGRTNAEIATALMISEGTVKHHVKNLLRKLNASNRADAVARFYGQDA
ncbi:helix-turn-helix transcriptional regulator [Conexibacter woesei]|uniref:Transcriptional regulator, LuxR family n=1 Tax=Conexibacter woesei (strain DSM 14684 / CCUG 47730 / CIP 108061 / JCM 11494 / NBRC 100937 / ID131577) TaxID=469383 RepID=D3F6X5_CONWI|nr:LuxR C-terminal-related transcriptional regulator [Conexibacter woesei]ADB52773.1 transcriptional regulator, LuxR family [Conexibacter woesei DSM 14684]